MADLNAILSRLSAPENASCIPAPVNDAIQSLSDDVTRTFPCTPSDSNARIVIRIRTRHVHWDAALMDADDGGDLKNTVGWYLWRWNVTTVRSESGTEVRVDADNNLMLDPAFTHTNEGTVLGRLVNEQLLYHELLHGQLLINAMDDPAWREKLCQTSTFDASARDADHHIIRGLERTYLLRRSGRYAVEVDPHPAADGTFSAVLGKVAPGYDGPYSVNYHISAEGNVRDLGVDMRRNGDGPSEIVIRGRLVDAAKSGYFLAAVASPAVMDEPPASKSPSTAPLTAAPQPSLLHTASAPAAPPVRVDQHSPIATASASSTAAATPSAAADSTAPKVSLAASTAPPKSDSSTTGSR